MSTLRFLEGDATQPEGEGPKVIVHVCNDVGGWGRGFVVALSRRWKAPENDYRSWSQGAHDEPFGLGEVRFVRVADEVWVANLIGQHDIREKDGQPPVRYDAIQAGLGKVAAFAQAEGASVHMPRIGCGLAGGTWSEVEARVRSELVERGVPVTVYDLPPRA